MIAAWALLGAALAQDAPEAPQATLAPRELPRDLVKLYGFVDGYFEKVAGIPTLSADGDIVREFQPHELDVLNFNIMGQGVLAGRYRFFFNLAGPGAGGLTDRPVQVRNAWVEAAPAGDRIALRIGKTYRRFGLYNEILDAVPTFIGIEPPEVLDPDRPLLPRTTNLMLHGSVPIGGSLLEYAAMTGTEDRGPRSVPVGLDLRWQSGAFLIGSSFYFSGGRAVPTLDPVTGQPLGGVAPWMKDDRYAVLGFFAEIDTGRFIFQTELWRSEHRATRDPAAVAALEDSYLLPSQEERLGLDEERVDDSVLAQDVSYRVAAGYIRTGYAFEVPVGEEYWEITPYLQGDLFMNPETIAPKPLGGDGEAGFGARGRFIKGTAGLVLRPIPAVALKVDGSMHIMRLSETGPFVTYPEVRVSYSLLWDLVSR